jgi:hypothetical protein
MGFSRLESVLTEAWGYAQRQRVEAEHRCDAPVNRADSLVEV